MTKITIKTRQIHYNKKETNRICNQQLVNKTKKHRSSTKGHHNSLLKYAAELYILIHHGAVQTLTETNYSHV